MAPRKRQPTTATEDETLYAWFTGTQGMPPEVAFKYIDTDQERRRKTFWDRPTTLVLLARIYPDRERWGAVCQLASQAGVFAPDLTDRIATFRTDHAEALHLTPEDLAADQGDARRRRNGQHAPPPPDTRQLRIVETTGDATRQMPYLWWPYIPRVGITFLDGDPGIGKTTLILTLAAIVSKGYCFPDQSGRPTLPGGGPGVTLYFSNENSLDYTIKPLLEAAGADRAQVKHVQGIVYKDQSQGAFTLDIENIPLLEARMQEYRPRLVILDPLQSYLGAKVDIVRSNETRPVLDRLTALSERYECAMVGLRHPAKAGADYGRLLYRGLGGIDLVGAARSVLFCERHPCHLDSQVLLVHAKTNKALGRTQIFTTADGVLGWKGVTRVNAATFERVSGPAPRALMEAVFWLESVLSEIPIPATDLETHAERDGLSPKVLRHARRVLGVESLQRADPETKQNAWWMRLPPLKDIFPPKEQGQQGQQGGTGVTGTTGTSGPNINDVGENGPPDDPEVPDDPDDPCYPCCPSSLQECPKRPGSPHRRQLLVGNVYGCPDCQTMFDDEEAL